MVDRSQGGARPGKKQPRAVDIAHEVGERLRMVRTLLLDNRTQFAAMYCVSYSNWQKWEEGRSYPDPAVMVMMCADWDLTMDWLYAGRTDGLKGSWLAKLYQVFPKEMARHVAIAKDAAAEAEDRRKARFGITEEPAAARARAAPSPPPEPEWTPRTRRRGKVPAGPEGRD